MGPQFVINEVSLDLKTGIICAILIFSGKVPLMRDKSIMHFNGTNKELLIRLPLPVTTFIVLIYLCN